MVPKTNTCCTCLGTYDEDKQLMFICYKCIRQYCKDCINYDYAFMHADFEDLLVCCHMCSPNMYLISCEYSTNDENEINDNQ